MLIIDLLTSVVTTDSQSHFCYWYWAIIAYITHVYHYQWLCGHKYVLRCCCCSVCCYFGSHVILFVSHCPAFTTHPVATDDCSTSVWSSKLLPLQRRFFLTTAARCHQVLACDGPMLSAVLLFQKSVLWSVLLLIRALKCDLKLNNMKTSVLKEAVWISFKNQRSWKSQLWDSSEKKWI